MNIFVRNILANEGTPQYTLDQLYITPFTRRKRWDEDGHWQYVNIERNLSPTALPTNCCATPTLTIRRLRAVRGWAQKIICILRCAENITWASASAAASCAKKAT